MMNKVTIYFTKRPWNPVSWAIRWSLPASRFKMARASHSMIRIGDDFVHASMLNGVIRQPFADAMKGQRIVATREYLVPDIDAGLAWLQGQIGKPYDWKGAFGIALDPYRDWREDDSWFCHELCAGFLAASGRKTFLNYGHVTDTALLLVNPA